MADARAEPVYVISVAAELAGVHPQTLREYERKGLVTPDRTTGNTRRYSDRDIERLRDIQRLTQEFGANLAGVSMIFDLRSQLARALQRVAALESKLDDAEAAARSDIADLHRRYRKDLVVYKAPSKPVRRA